MIINAIIEKSESGGFGIYSEDIEGAFGFGLTESEAKEDFQNVIEEQAEYYKDKTGTFPKWYVEGYTIEYAYDISGFFKAFPFINVSKFAEELEINPSLMRKYKGKIVTASEGRRALIQKKYDGLVARMAKVKF